MVEWLDPEIDWRGPREFPDLAESRIGHWERHHALEAAGLSGGTAA
jgi:hypothetical protein